MSFPGLNFSYIHVTAEVQTPEICILSSTVVMEEVYLNVPFIKQIEVENKSLLKATFCWIEVSLLVIILTLNFICCFSKLHVLMKFNPGKCDP